MKATAIPAEPVLREQQLNQTKIQTKQTKKAKARG